MSYSPKVLSIPIRDMPTAFILSYMDVLRFEAPGLEEVFHDRRLLRGRPSVDSMGSLLHAIAIRMGWIRREFRRMGNEALATQDDIDAIREDITQYASRPREAALVGYLAAYAEMAGMVAVAKQCGHGLLGQLQRVRDLADKRYKGVIGHHAQTVQALLAGTPELARRGFPLATRVALDPDDPDREPELLLSYRTSRLEAPVWP
ncbi:MAG: hypothetical protein KatS3mg126_0759 [Lysobacteraceae bacterium]|nr:MAG: hypothetical protein KatS3mg126_0759 [Xanthomonadaceae bacterium]